MKRRHIGTATSVHWSKALLDSGKPIYEVAKMIHNTTNKLYDMLVLIKWQNKRIYWDEIKEVK